ncbi:MAG: porin family protein [Candidatus Limimorpha sp.]
MKKSRIVVLLLAVLFVAVSGKAQNDSVRHMNNRYGVKVGLSQTNLAFDKFDQNRWRSCPMFGVFYEYNINELLAVQGELQYERLGTRIADSTFTMIVFTHSGVVDCRVILQYISLPISLKLKANRWLSFEFGPKFSYCFSGRLNTTTFVKNNGPQAENYFVIDRKVLHDDQYNHWDVSGFIGAEAKLTRRFGIGIRYAHGFLNALTDKCSATKMNSSANRVFTVFIVYSM